MALALLRGIIRGLLALVLLLGILLIALPFLIDLTFVKDYLRNQGEQALEGPIDYDEATLALFPYPRAEFHHLSVGGASPFFRTDRLEVTLDFWPLMHQQIVIRDLTIEHPQLSLHQAADRSWNIPGIDDEGEPPSQGKDGAHPPIPVIWQLTITNGRVTFLDETLDAPLFIEVDAIDAVLSSLNDGWPADLRLSGHPVTLGSDARLTLAGTVDWTRAALEPGDRVQELPFFQGKGKLDRVSIHHIQRIVDRGGPADHSDQKDHIDHAMVSLTSPVEMVPGTPGYDLICPHLTLHVPDAEWTVQGMGRLGGLFTKNPSLFVSGSAEPVKFQRLSGFLPLVPKDAREVIVDQKIDGLVRIQKITVAGSLAKDEPISVVGEFEVARGQVLVQPELAPVEGIAGTVVLEPDLITIVNARARYESSHMTLGNGTIDFHTPSPWLDARASLELSMLDVTASLRQGLGPPDLVPWAKKIHNPSGTALVSLHLIGPLDNPDALTLEENRIQAQNIGFQHPALPTPVRALTGRMEVTAGQLLFQNVTAHVGRSSLTAEGILITEADPIFRNLRIKGRIHGDQIRPFLRDRAEAVSVTGTVDLSAHLEGLAVAPSFDLHLALENAEIALPDVLKKPAGIEASIDARGRVTPKTVLLVDHLDVEVSPLRLRAKGELEMVGPYRIQASVTLLDPLPLDKLPKSLTLAGGAIKSGTLSLSASAKGRGFDWSQWKTYGEVSVTNATIIPKGLDHPIEDLSLNVALTNQTAKLKPLTFRIEQNHIHLTGTVYQWMTTPEASLTLTSPNLDVDTLLDQTGADQSGKGETGEEVMDPGPNGNQSPWSKLRVSVGVDVDHGRFRNVPFTNLRGQMAWKEGTLLIDPFYVEIDGDLTTGKLHLPLHRASPADAVISMDVRNLALERLFQLLGREMPPIKGKLFLAGSLHGQGTAWADVQPTLTGEVKGSIRKGRVLHLTALSRILQILNLPTLLQGKIDLQKGLPFDRIAGNFSLQRSTITTKELLLESPVLTLSAAGTYNLTPNQLDMVAAVSPLGSYFKLLKSIPLFGKLFAGKRQEFDTAFFEIKGSPQDPSVKYMPIQSLTANVTGLASLAFDVLKNTVTLPKELISPSQ